MLVRTEDRLPFAVFVTVQPLLIKCLHVWGPLYIIVKFSKKTQVNFATDTCHCHYSHCNRPLYITSFNPPACPPIFLFYQSVRRSWLNVFGHNITLIYFLVHFYNFNNCNDIYLSLIPNTLTLLVNPLSDPFNYSDHWNRAYYCTWMYLHVFVPYARKTFCISIVPRLVDSGAKKRFL